METGLRFRLRRALGRIGEQHRHLREIHGLIRDSVERRDAESCRAALEKLRGAVSGHFALEEEVFFPAIHGLRPDRTGEIRSLEREHESFQARIDRLIERLDPRRIDALTAEFDAFEAALREHEAREESLVSDVSADESAAG